MSGNDYIRTLTNLSLLKGVKLFNDRCNIVMFATSIHCMVFHLDGPTENTFSNILDKKKSSGR